jgi:hypothetical protein
LHAFSFRDPAERKPIGRRFAEFLSVVQAGPVSDLARVEAALTHVAPRDPVSRTLPWREQHGEEVVLAAGAELLRIDYDVLDRTARQLARAPRLKAPRFLGVVRSGSQEVAISELPAELAEVLLAAGGRPLRRTELPVGDEAVDELLDQGLLVPNRYRS